jgi:cytochrome c oxidase subunit 3
MSSKQYHPWHLVEPSPWPLTGAVGAFGLTTGSVMYFHKFEGGSLLVAASLSFVILVMIVWWRDVIREASYQGHHTTHVQNGLRIGMLLFILSEVCFFFSFFWAFFHSSLGPDISIGSVWPPVGIEVLDPFEVPLLNTVILVSSGASVTWSHNALISGDRKNTILSLIITILLGLVFTALQAMEYFESSFTIADSVYGTTFFVATGFHGLHVIIGTLFLIVCLWRIVNHHFTRHHSNGFEAAIWYWHFVDYVWLFLYASIYTWGSLGA